MDQVRQHRCDAACNQRSGGRCRKPSRDALPDLHLPELARERFGGEKIAFHEASESAADSILVAGNDGSVGNGQTQRVAEKSRHREPISKAADHPRLGPGLDEQRRETRLRNHSGAHKYDSHDHEQAGSNNPIAPQPQASSLIGALAEQRNRSARQCLYARGRGFKVHAFMQMAARRLEIAIWRVFCKRLAGLRLLLLACSS